MILTPHAIVGAALANIFPNDPALGFGLAFFSHYALDMLPHTDYDINNFFDKETKTVRSVIKNAGAAMHLLVIILDFIFAIFLCVLLFVRDEKSLMITLLGVLGGLLPDFLQFIYYKFKKEPWIFIQKIHDKFHFDTKIKHNILLGIFVQILIPVLILILYFFIRK